MNLRVLKKLSKKAAVLLPQLLPRHHNAKESFLARKGENYHGLVIEQPHGAVHRCRWYADRERVHALKGTPMRGGMDGGEQPEWWEKTAWEVFTDVVWWACVDDTWEPAEDEWYPPLRAGIVLETPADYLRQARRLIAEGVRI